jgi:hypothetical protein
MVSLSNHEGQNSVLFGRRAFYRFGACRASPKDALGLPIDNRIQEGGNP